MKMHQTKRNDNIFAKKKRHEDKNNIYIIDYITIN